MVKLPEKIKIGAHEYKVLCPYNFRERNDLCGQCNNSLLEIRIDKNDSCGNHRAESKIIGSFIHEVIHGISETWSIGLKEEQVEQLEEGILAVLIDNGFLKIGGTDDQ